METLKIDRTKLITPANYAKKFGIGTRQTVYNMIKREELKSVEIDGVTFVLL